MDANREKQLVDLLNHYDTSAVPFYKAKQELLSQGFSEAEIVFGLYSAPYDGKANEPQPDNPLHKFYEEHPDKADKLAKTLLLSGEEMDWDKTAADAAAARFGPDIQTRSYYEVRTADRLGIPYFTLMGIGIVIAVAAIALKFSKEITQLIFILFQVLVSTIFGYKLYQDRRRITRLRKEIADDKVSRSEK